MTLNVQMGSQLSTSQSKLFNVPAPPPRRGSVCQPQFGIQSNGGGARGSAERIASGVQPGSNGEIDSQQVQALEIDDHFV